MMAVKLNIGTLDMALRIITGAALLSLVFVGPKTVWGLMGLIPLLTGLFRWCPAYRLLGIKTREENKSSR